MPTTKTPSLYVSKEARELVSQDPPATDFPGSSCKRILPCMQDPRCIYVTARLQIREANHDGQITSDFLIQDSGDLENHTDAQALEGGGGSMF